MPESIRVCEGREANGAPTQVRGFTNTWRWDEQAADRVARLEADVAHPHLDATVAFKRLLDPSEMLAYLTYMGDASSRCGGSSNRPGVCTCTAMAQRART
ncbi:MAG: hypothetical protein OXG37_11435 [Actinomycetia bacterium]|nr:hypothetical protein [Actinomycetes bacterium]